MWTQWGAQARAAEYNAAKNAAARRTSEELKLPQKATAVSLSAFTKNAPVNRNKGTKAWKPLVLEATPESDNDSAQNNDEMPTTPTRLIPTVNSSLSEDSDIKIARSSDSSSRPGSIAPTAPKAMLKLSQNSSLMANPTPKRVQPHSIIQQTQQAETPSVHSSPRYLARTGGYPKSAPEQRLRFTWFYDLQGLPVIVPLRMPVEPVSTPYLGKIMRPDDLSPTKQENKLAAMSREFAAPPPINYLPQCSHFTPPAGIFANPVLVDDQHFAPYQAGVLSADLAHRPVIHHINSDSVVEVDGNHSDSSSFSVPTIVRHYYYPDGVAATTLGQPLAVEQAIPSAVPAHGFSPVVHSPGDEPYDRKSRMESFVAAHQALAKTGRTVLHNPDLHRVRATEKTSPARSGSTATTPEREPGKQAFTPGSVTILKPPPGFRTRPVDCHAVNEDNANPSPIDQASLRHLFEVDSKDWLGLKPVTKSQRMNMNKVMSIFARAQAPDQTQPFAQKTYDERKDDLQKWMQVASKDNRPVTATQKLFEEAARDRLSGNPGGANVDGAGEDQLSRAEIECAGICAVGDIVANLMEDPGALGAGKDSEGLFPKYKPAPEYAIERSRLLMGNGGSTSFFEDNIGGFYTAPSRIARDPRFRPAGKEAIQVKPDEIWKLRADMYSRRRM